MTTADIIYHRLANQHITRHWLKRPEQIVAYLGAMQAQEYAHAKWAIGLRLPGTNDADVEQACNDGKILRTHMMRPTWHFVTPADIRWMQQATKHRVHALNRYYALKLELDSKTINKACNLITKALEGNNHRTRNELAVVLEKNKITAAGQKLAYLMMHAELECLICSGVRKGKQHTYALLDERVPAVKPMEMQDARAKLAEKYFTARGPATIADFSWWSGLTVTEAKDAAATLNYKFERAVVNGQEYIFIPTDSKATATFIMPDYDEYGISYKDRSAIASVDKKLKTGSNGESTTSYHSIITDGIIGGTWQKTTKDNKIDIELLGSPPKARQRKVATALKEYLAFSSG